MFMYTKMYEERKNYNDKFSIDDDLHVHKMYWYIPTYDLVRIDWMVVKMMKYQRIINKLMKYAEDYNYYEFMDSIDTSSPIAMLKEICNERLRKGLINYLKEDLAETNDIEQVNDAVELIVELNNL